MLGSKRKREMAPVLVAMDQNEDQKATPTATPNPKLPVNRFSSLADSLLEHIFLWLGGEAAIPLAVVDRRFSQKIRALRLPSGKNTKNTFIYSEINPSLPYQEPHDVFYQKYLKLMKDLRYLKRQGSLIPTVTFEADDFLFLVKVNAINAFQNIFKEYKDVLTKGKVEINGEDIPVETFLFNAAIEAGHEALIKLFLKYDMKIFTTGPDQVTPLITAIIHGQSKMVKLFLAEGRADTFIGGCKFIDMPDGNGGTPLHYAANLGRVEIVKLLKQFGVNENLRDKDETTVFEDLLRHSQLPLKQKMSIFDILLSDPEQKDSEGAPLILLAIYSGFPLSRIEKLYQAKRENLTVTCTNGENAFHAVALAPYESSEEHLKVLNFIYDRMPRPYFHEEESEEKNNPFLLAAKHNAKPTAIQFFLDKHLAQAHAQNSISNKFMIGLSFLALNGKAEAIQHVLESLRDKPNLIEEIIHEIGLSAVKSGSRELVSLFLDKKWRFWENSTPRRLELFCKYSEFHKELFVWHNDHQYIVLHIAAKYGHVNLLRLFIERNCMEYKGSGDEQIWVDRRGWDRETPAIATAVMNGQADAVSVLVKEAKADVNFIDGNGETLLHHSFFSSTTPENKAKIFLTLFPLVSEQVLQVFKKDNESNFPFFLNAITSDMPLVIFEKLSEIGVDFSRVDQRKIILRNHGNAFHFMADVYVLNSELLNYLYEKIRILVDAPDGNGITPLYYAIANLNITVVHFFLEKNTNTLSPVSELNGQYRGISSATVSGDALGIAISWKFARDVPCTEIAKNARKDQLEIIKCIISHLQKIAAHDLHSQQIDAKKSLHKALLMLINEDPKKQIDYKNECALIELLLATLDKETVSSVIGAIFKVKGFAVIDYLLLVTKKIGLLTQKLLDATFHRICQLLYEHSENELLMDSEVWDRRRFSNSIRLINQLLLNFIHAGANLCDNNPLHQLLLIDFIQGERYKFPDDVPSFCYQVIPQLITQLQKIAHSDSPHKAVAAKILEQAEFTIVEKNLSKDYLTQLNAGVKPPLMPQASTEAKSAPDENPYEELNQTIYASPINADFINLNQTPLNPAPAPPAPVSAFAMALSLDMSVVFNPTPHR